MVAMAFTHIVLQVNGFPGALHKSFGSQSEAEEYVLGVSASTPVQSSLKRPSQSASVLNAKQPALVKDEPVKVEPVCLGHIERSFSKLPMLEC